MVARHIFRGAAGVAVASILTACGPAKPVAEPKPAASAPPPAPPPRAEVHERVVPHTCATRAKITALLGQGAPAPAPPPAVDADSAAPPTSVGATARVAGNQAYRSVAPATALLRTEHGMGTGVVVDPAGYVLTNYHVIADGRQKDFVVTVDVSFGDMTPTGRMTRQEKSYDGVVVKADPVRDLALVRVKDPPAKLTAVKLAPSAPQIAERVMSIGHAGIGFLWAAKSCSVASVGERQHDASVLAGLDCSRPDPTMGPEAAATRKKACEDQKKLMTEALLAKTQGLAVQTDCAITHGDSGGPLVNSAGELVGLNQSISADLATASFHIHLDEVRDFIAKHADDGVALLPDPYCDGGLTSSLEDLDLDGTPDTLVTKGDGGLFSGYDRMAALIDLDQDHYTREKPSANPFDAEIALLMIRGATYVFYDTDADARFDLVLVDKDNDGAPENAYRVDAEGRAKEDRDALPKHDLSVKLVPDASLHARLGKIGAAMGSAKYTSKRALGAAAKDVSLPDMTLGAGVSGLFVDSDHDGKSDTLFVRNTFSRGLLVDADQKALAEFPPGEAKSEMLAGKKLHTEVSVIVQGNAAWALYDTDGDAKPNLALMTTVGTDASWLYATNAWTVGPGGALTAAPEHLGRKLLRPSLIAAPRTAVALRSTGFDIAADDAAGSLPDPRAPRGDFHFRELKGVPKGAVVEATSLSSSALLIDADRSTLMAPKADPEKVVNDGKFKAEVAFIHRGGMEWVFYDTDGDNEFDLVLFVPTPGQDPAMAYRLAKAPGGKGPVTVTADPSAAPGKPFRHSVFKNKLVATKWKDIAGKLFKASAIER